MHYRTSSVHLVGVGPKIMSRSRLQNDGECGIPRSTAIQWLIQASRGGRELVCEIL